MKPYRTTHKNEHRKAQRDGFTLIEMLIVITIFVFLLASAAMAIGTLFRAQGDLQDELIEANTASRLASQLRCDAHLANSAELTRDGEWTLSDWGSVDLTDDAWPAVALTNTSDRIELAPSLAGDRLAFVLPDGTVLLGRVR